MSDAAFQLDEFVSDCLAVASDPAAVAEVVRRAVSDPRSIERVLTRQLRLADLGVLHYSPQLTIQHVVFPRGHRTGVHDHLTWAVIGTWTGYEDNHLYRRTGNGIEAVGVTRCEPGEVVTMTSDDIHEVHAPSSTGSVALHVYGGALFDQPRHTWSGRPLAEQPADDAANLDRYLAELRADGSLSE